MIPKDCKRLAEVDFPIAEVSRHAAREKSIRHGHPSTLHLWWARRPLASSRAVLLGLLLEEQRTHHQPGVSIPGGHHRSHRPPGLRRADGEGSVREALHHGAIHPLRAQAANPTGTRQSRHEMTHQGALDPLVPRAAAEAAGRRLQEPIRDPARLDWHEVTKVAHYHLSVNAMTKPMQVREDSPPYGGNRP